MMSSRARVLSTCALGLLLTAMFALLGVASPEIVSAAPLSRGIEYDRTADGEWAVAGSSREDGFRGAAHVYRRAGGRWVLEATLAPEERGAFARFGASVAMSGNTLVVGAPWDDGWHGAAYVYERSGTTWRLAARLTPAGTVGDRFGTRVESADGVVSLASDAGAIVRFRRTGAAWTAVEHVPAGGATLAPARTVDAELHDATSGLAAQSPGLVPTRAIAIAAPDSVWASDGTFEDRTDVRWTPVSAGPLLYKIYRRLASDPPSSNVLIRVASQEDVLFSDVTGTRGVAYTYCVSVVDMDDVEGTSRCDDGRRIIFAPTGFLASDATFEGHVRLQWSDRSSIEAGYRIRRDGALLRELDPDMTTFNDSTAVPGIGYLYELTAFDAAGSATAPLTDGGQSASIAAPLQVSATDGQFTDRVVITWLDPTLLETNYRVYRANGGPPTLLATLPAGTTSYEDLTAVNGTPYDYCVAAVDAGNQESARSCDAGGIGILPPAANVQATDGTFDDKVRITWEDASETEDGFLLYRMPAGTTDSTLVANVGAGVTSFEDTGGEHGVAYGYCVVAFSKSGGRSAPACDDGLRAVVLAPVAVQATDGAFEDRVDLTWESTSSTAVLFKIHRGATFIRSVSGDRRSYSDPDVTSGVTASYRVVAVNALGAESTPTADDGFRRVAAPVSARASDDEFEDRVEVSWTDRSAIESGFFVYRRLAGSADTLVRIATRPANSVLHVDRSGLPGQAYDYVVTAFQAYGPGRADTTESDQGTNPGSRALLAPTFVHASDGEFEDHVELTWVDNSRYEESYEVWRRDTASNDSARVAVLPRNADRYEDAAIAFGAQYEYSVVAVDSLDAPLLGRSPAGRDIGGTSLLPPGSVSASDLYTDRVVVAWIDQSALETGYRVLRDGVQIGATGANVTSFADFGVVPGIAYTYCVQSLAAGQSSETPCDVGAAVQSSIDPTATVTLEDRLGAGGEALLRDHFGAALGGDGTRVIVGIPGSFQDPCPECYNNQQDSRATVYVRQDSAFVLEKVIGASYPGGPPGRLNLGSGFLHQARGGAVALHGNSAIIASTGKRSGPGAATGLCADAGTGYCGAIYFVERSPSTGAWSLGPTILDLAGTSSADMNGQWAVVGGTGPRAENPGVPSPEGTGAGASFRVYRRSGTSWVEAHRFSEASPANFRYFGSCVALADSTALVGAPTTNGVTPAVYVFRSNAAGAWSQVQSLTNPGGSVAFGRSVAIHGSRAVVGDPGTTAERAWVFERDAGGTWTFAAELLPEGGGVQGFGTSVSVHGDSILVGAPAARSGEGLAYLFTRVNGVWVRGQIQGPGGAAPSARLGVASRVMPGALAVGADGTTIGGIIAAGSAELAIDATIPGPAAVTASDGTYKDKVQVNWSDNYTTETGFRLYRDGTSIVTVEPNIRNYVDFDAEPGRTHEYCVVAVFAGGTETAVRCDFGRRIPDGNITGRVATQTGAGISGARVSLEPAPNRALLLDGSGGAMTVPDGAVFGDAFTLEFWYRGHATGSGATLVRYSSVQSGNAFTVTNPANLTVSVNGVAQATGVALDDGEWHHVAVDRTRADGALHVYKDGQPAFTGVLASGVGTGTGGAVTFGAALSGALDDIRVWSRVRTPAEVDSAKRLPLTGTEAGLAAYWPLDAYEGTGAEEPVANRYGRLASGAHWIGEAAPVSAFAVTDLQGNYVLPKIRYGTSTTFRVMPEMEGHQYEPAFKTITLSTGNPVQNEVAFNDITSYTASGFVRYPGTPCVAANVPILVDGEVRGTTDGSGRYAVPVPPGAHTIEPRLPGHTFLPAAITLENVVGDVADQNFSETTERRLQGTVGGGCGVPIGTLTLRIDSENGCFTRSFDASAGFDEALPPLKYAVRVTHVAATPGGVDPVAVQDFFDVAGPIEVDLSSADATIEFRYRAPLRVEIAGLPDVDPTCGLGVPVIAQTERYPLTIHVVEDYGTRTCDVDSGTVTVFDEIIDQEKTPVTLVIKNGYAYVSTDNGLVRYETAGNRPNIFAGRVDSEGRDRSYQKSFTVVADVAGQDPVTKTEWVIVTGHRPRAATFTALSEGIPLFVLRDPPGDGSYSSLSQETSFCTKLSNTILRKASTGFNAKAILGLNIELGLFVMTKVKAQAFVQGGIELGVEWKSSDEMEICGRTTEEFKTSADNLFIGRDGDLYVGMAMNLLFAKTDVIAVEGCQVVASEDVTVGVDDIPTVYSFTDYHIRNVLIPQLVDLARLNPVDSLRYNSARRNWEAHLALNDSLKSTAQQTQNRSFSAGAEYTYTTTVDTTKSQDWSVNVFGESQYGAGFDFEVAGSGSGFSYYSKFGLAYERGGATTEARSRTTSYTLTDDDIGDFFSVAVKNDPLFGTPVFDIVGGTTSCPWEPWPDPVTGLSRTQPVDGPRITVEPPVRNNVPIGSPAVFTLNLTNDGQAGQLREYRLYTVTEENPGGAIIRVDGDPINNGVSFFLEDGQTRQATLTVERGPTQYFYKNLKIVMVPPCEYELFRSGGPLNLTNSVLFSVGFEAPCSDIRLALPNPGWSAPTGADSLELRLADFELAISEQDSLVSIGAEYQRVGTDVWSPIGFETPLSKLALGVDGKPASVRLMWPLAGVPDGSYTLRAFTRCPDGRNYSSPATGVIDRGAPLVFGTPEPADGTLSFGESIAITYNEDLDCTTTGGATVKLELLGGPTPTAMGSSVVCNGRTLVISPTADLAAYEGRELRATVGGIRDKVGNVADTTRWTFTVRQGEFAWAQANVSSDVGYGAGGRVAVNLVNGLGSGVQYALSGLPAWLVADPAASDLIPGRSQVEVAFQVDPNTAIGSYDATITATATTNPPGVPRVATLDVRVNVLRVPPTWAVDPADYEHSMTVRAKLYVEGDSSTSPDDVLAAFVGTQVRGVARPQLVADGWRYFLTVYGKPPAFERVRFKVWDSATSKTYTATDKTLVFAPDSTYGGYGKPLEIRTRVPSPANEQVIAVNSGWTWFSVNRRPTAQDDRTVAAVLSNLNPTPGDLVKAQDGRISMFDGTAGWIGTLDTLGVTTSYRLRMAEAGEIRYESVRVLPSAYAIPVKKGWNWIGYTPDDTRPVGSALAGLASGAGDILRSQSAFSEFAQSLWAGSLADMGPGRGYTLYRTNALETTFTYADVPAATTPVLASDTAPIGGGADRLGATDLDLTGALAPRARAWEVDYGAFQYDMIVTAEVAGLPPGGLHQVAAVVEGEIRGVARPVHVPALGKTLVFLMVRSNQAQGETIRFQVLDQATGDVYAVAQSVAFEADAVLGSTATPVPLVSEGVAITNFGRPATFELASSRPNPLRGNGVATLSYAVPSATHVSIEMYDVTGRRVRTIVDEDQAPGWYDVTIEPSGMGSGVYFYRMRAGSFTATRRMVVVQ